MGNELIRSVEEIIALYQLEPETRDIYVEGITDKLLLERFVKKNQLIDVKIIEVHELDFSYLTKKKPSIMSNNKGKLLELSLALEREIPHDLSGITIILDKDFDEIDKILLSSKYLKYTDYNSIESYLFNPHTIDIFYKHILHSFPIDGRQTLSIFTPVLIDVFFIRYTINKTGLLKKFLPFHKSVVVDKSKCSIKFDYANHIFKVLNDNKMTSSYSSSLEHFKSFKTSLKTDAKNLVRGHDFIELFYFFIDKIKNDIGLTLETFERLIFQCVDYSVLKKEKLFTFILNKY